MGKRIVYLLLSALVFVRPQAVHADELQRTLLILKINPNGKIDKNKDRKNPRKNSAYIPFQALYDKNYIYVVSRISISEAHIISTYGLKNDNGEKVSEGVLSVASGSEQKISISSLPDGEYKLEVTLGEQTYEGNFGIGEQ